MITPENWYILQRSGIVYLCHSDEVTTVIHNYTVNSNMLLCVYDDNEEYVLDPAQQHPNHRMRTYDFTIDFCVWNLPRRPTKSSS